MSSAPSDSRNKRKSIVGFVTSRSGDKSVKVTIPYKTPHPRFHKVINMKTVVHAHDEKNETKVGDKVSVMETRPLSRLKRWRVLSVLESAVGTTAEAITEADVAATVPTKTTRPSVAAPAAAPEAAAAPAPTA
jgi:small subunit ribosomal protein S17